MIAFRRVIGVSYDDASDCAYLSLTSPRRDAQNSVPVMLNDEGVDGHLVIDRDEKNRIIGIEVIGAMGILPAAFLLDEEEDDINITPSKSIVTRIRFMTERTAILGVLTNILDTHERTGLALDVLIKSEIRDRNR